MHARNTISSLVVGSLLMGACQIAVSAENNELAVPMGIWGLDSAILPLSGVYGQVIMPSYRATSVKDANGDDMTFNYKKVPGVAGTINARIKVDAVVPKLIYVSEEPILGGRYGGYIAVPLLDKSRKITVNVAPLPLAMQQKLGSVAAQAMQQQIGQTASQAASGSKSGLGDIEVAGFIGWKFENLSVVAAMNVDLPTGSFDAKSMVNLGTNYYSFRPLVSAAWSTESGFDVAASFAYNVSTANRDTSYKSGQYVHLEYVGTYQFNNNFKAGLQGYYLNQTTDDKDPKNSASLHSLEIIKGNRARVTALGPVMSYQTDDLKTQVELKYLREMSARARPEGDLALITLSRLF